MTSNLVLGVNCPAEIASTLTEYSRSPGFHLMSLFNVKQTLASVKGTATSILLCSLAFSSAPDVVIKRMKKAPLKQTGQAQVLREIHVHRALSHRHILPLYAAFEDPEHIYLALEHAPLGDLYAHSLKGKGMRESDAALRVLKPLLRALDYLHTRGIIHRVRSGRVFPWFPALALSRAHPT